MLRDDGKIVAFLRYKCLVKPLGNLKGYLTHFAVLQGAQASFELGFKSTLTLNLLGHPVVDAKSRGKFVWQPDRSRQTIVDKGTNSLFNLEFHRIDERAREQRHLYYVVA